jgi:hypothetical protein
MLLKKINRMNSMLKERNFLEDVDFKQILIDSDLLITQSDLVVIDSKTVDIEYTIIDISTNEALKTRSIGKSQNVQLAQQKAYEYMQKMIFSYEKSFSSKQSSNKNDSLINRNQQKRLFTIASYEKIHSVIELMGYTSIKDIKISDFPKIVQFLEIENVKKYISKINTIPNAIIDFGKYKGKNIREIIIDRNYLEYLYKNAKNKNIKIASAKALQIHKA